VDIRRLAQNAKQASRVLAGASSTTKDEALSGMVDALERRMGEILQENAHDLADGRKKGLSEPQLDRLLLDETRIKAIAEGLRHIRALPNPVGEIVSGWRTPEGLQIEQRRVPLGLVAVVYEARPNVTVDAAALCLKAGNSVILRGGSDAYHSNRLLAEVMTGALLEAGLPGEAIQFVSTRDRAVLLNLLRLVGLVDLVIARGGEALKSFVEENSQVPVIYAARGNCHIYVDRAADLRQALAIIINAKVQRPGVSNAAETLLVHRDAAAEFVPWVARELLDRRVRLYADPTALSYLDAAVGHVEPASDVHYATEFLGLELALRVVDSLDQAIEHIDRFGTGHSECIVTRDLEAAQRFANDVDAAAVYVNASTRFTDGGAYGLGAEIGVSTQKLHARGPVALKELTSTKYIVTGRGHVR
jgi:glutamate-5-semialdehyde dehydrogenase